MLGRPTTAPAAWRSSCRPLLARESLTEESPGHTCGTHKGQRLAARAGEGDVLDDRRVCHVRERGVPELYGALAGHNVLGVRLVLRGKLTEVRSEAQISTTAGCL